ncbi:helix-turn-helix domain-containing transcriptional regulator [Glycocaulis sp.]
MPLTRDFKTLVKERAERDQAFRAALYAEALEALIEGDADTARAMLRDYVNATLGFERLEALTGTPRKSLMRMLGPSGNPGLDKLAPILRVLNAETGVNIAIRTG